MSIRMCTFRPGRSRILRKSNYARYLRPNRRFCAPAPYPDLYRVHQGWKTAFASLLCESVFHVRDGTGAQAMDHPHSHIPLIPDPFAGDVLRISHSISNLKVPSMLGQSVRDARLKKGFTQARLAKMAGVSRRHLAALEKGANVSVSILQRVAVVLELTEI